MMIIPEFFNRFRLRMTSAVPSVFQKFFRKTALPFFIGMLAVLVSPVWAGHPCAHILICCWGANRGVTFEVNGEQIPNHDYGQIDQARDIFQKLKEAGIQTVIVDMTNASQWTRLWDVFEPILSNIQQVCAEKDMQFFIFIGAALMPEMKEECHLDPDLHPFKFWNDIAGKIWDTWAQKPTYRKYGFGDDRPMLLVFQPSVDYWPQFNNVPEEYKNNMNKFRIGTTQVNDPITSPEESDGWGYRSKWQNRSGSVRLASSNGGIVPGTWYKIDAEEWEKQVRWASEASEYSVYGSYDDTCDGFCWGIADTSKSQMKYNCYPDPQNPRYYYDIVKKVLNGDTSK